jgi:hypothetical protein
VNDVPLPVQDNSLASNHTGPQDIFPMDFSEDSAYVWLRNEARSFPRKSRRRPLV